MFLWSCFLRLPICIAERSRKPAHRLLSVSSFLFGKVIPFKMFDTGEGIYEVILREWYIKPGDRVKQFDEICEVQSDKSSVTISSRYQGVVKTLHHKVDDVVTVGSVLYDIELDDEDSKDEEPAKSAKTDTLEAKEKEAEELQENSFERVLATPAVRKIARENNINLKDVTATGKARRVLKEDILAHLKKTFTEDEAAAIPSHSGVKGKTVGLKGYTKYMWKTMTRSLSIPHFVYSDECNVDQVIRYRNEVKGHLAERNIFLTYLPFFIKAASRALDQCPELNAWLDEESQTLRLLDNHNIGVAMDTPEGLVVPNIKNVQNLSVLAIARELNRLQECGKKATISSADLADTTFSLSNIGVVGGTYTKPVIVPPQVIIGALGRVQRLPRFDDKGNVVPANIMAVSWSADHRVVDGVTVAKFSNLWKHYVENPACLLIGA
ncbi:hypothetical protein PUN28_016552 [Cardiocondyla obscurior]|uniref:Dihydrolipoamide acetyltransferase component of pyruvate dehydrogenase complex n=1 Tax=Cardiocondyla obscurior TaxID=286306 RepID=A0AAW2ERH5_9HYME